MFVIICPGYHGYLTSELWNIGAYEISSFNDGDTVHRGDSFVHIETNFELHKERGFLEEMLSKQVYTDISFIAPISGKFYHGGEREYKRSGDIEYQRTHFEIELKRSGVKEKQSGVGFYIVTEEKRILTAFEFYSNFFEVFYANANKARPHYPHSDFDKVLRSFKAEEKWLRHFLCPIVSYEEFLT